MNLHWLMQMSRWARNPPSWRTVRLVVAVIAACLLLVGIEHVWGWPDWLTVNGMSRGF